MRRVERIEVIASRRAAVARGHKRGLPLRRGLLPQARPKLIPEAKMNSYKQPPKTLPRSPGNEREWLDACLGSKVKPGGNFEFSGLVTETLLLGNLAVLSGQKLNWDRANLKVVNSDLAQKLVRPDRRPGWEL